MTAINIPRPGRKPIVTRAFVRNGDQFCPDADLMRANREESNRLAFYRLKSWSFATPRDQTPSPASGAKDRWLFKLRTSKHHWFMSVRPDIAPCEGEVDPYVIVAFTRPGEVLPDGYIAIHNASTFTGVLDVPSNYISTDMVTTNITTGEFASLLPDTEYECRIIDNRGMRTMSISIHEVALAGDTDNGYLAPGFVAGQPIFDKDREEQIEFLRDVYLANGGPLITWSTHHEDSPVTRTSATLADLVATTFTGTPDATWPGFFLPLARHGRAGQETVSCVLEVRGSVVEPGNGHVFLFDELGNEYADIEIDTEDDIWRSTAVELPAADRLYYLLFGGNGTHETTVRAVSLYQYKAP